MLEALLLAAGRGTRMVSKLPKAIHPMLGKPMIEYLLRALPTEVEKIWVVTGYKGDEVEGAITYPSISFVRQREQRGTGDAVMAALPYLSAEQILVVSGDMPLVRKSSLEAAARLHLSQSFPLTLLTAELFPPEGYGRVLRKGDEVISIVEEEELSSEEMEIREVNTGIYLFSRGFLEQALPHLLPHPPKGEYYLTDVVRWATSRGYRVGSWKLPDTTEAIGVNTRADLAKATEIVRERKAQELLNSGVTLIDPTSLYVEVDVSVGPDATIYPWVFLQGSTEVGEGCVIYPQVRIVDSLLGSRVKVLDNSLIEEAVLEDEVIVGPLAHLRPGTHLKKGVKIGNFVEVKQSVIGGGSKVNHLTYIGDATIGTGVNVGAGTITCNYDGVRKHPTFIGDGAFIGSDCQLVAPVRIGNYALVGAGSTIVEDVPDNALALSRSPQSIVEGKGMIYFRKKRD